MSYQVRTETRPTTNGLDGTVYVLEGSGGARAEIWPALGCNCYRWQVPVQGKMLDLLYAAPNLLEDTRPTRSGIPILLPFPNRIRDGRFSWQGKEYRLPLNDSTLKNSIHGFACRRPWRILEQGTTASSAWLTAEFHAAKDSPETRDFWPADYRIQLTFRLDDRRLRLEARLDNVSATSLPFGLGYHPYFRVPLVPDGKAEECLIEVQADRYWELAESLPTGKQLPVDQARDLTRPRPYAELTLDDVLIASPNPPKEGDLVHRGSMRQGAVELSMRTSPEFRELVVFTPQHRQAFCLEPYTCTTDAINLQARGSAAGLLVLEPGKVWTGVVEMEVK